jgi:hypothetical protein
MALVLNEEQLMLRDAARSFLSERAPVSHLRELRDSGDEAGFSGVRFYRYRHRPGGKRPHPNTLSATVHRNDGGLGADRGRN